ncbi:MAG: DUF3987 domain-containing protein [Parabacteroides sp.]|nr:DUF3987 domain-containing protein [Parabacteroides sp.]
MLNSLDRLVEAVRLAGADIAHGYSEYVRLALAIATDCGEAGRSGFITLCSLSTKFNRENADRLYSNVLKKGGNRVHLGTAFYLAELAGVKVGPPEPSGETDATDARPPTNATNATNAASNSHTRARIYNVEVESEEQTDPLTPLPFFTEKYAWPRVLRRVMAFGQTKEQRDVLFLGAITALGASLALTLRFLYGGKWFFPSLQTFIVAPPASGKGVLSWVRMLVQPIHDEIRAKVTEEMKAYRKKIASYNSLGREKGKAEEPEMPLNRMFIFSGNNTGTGMLQNIIDSGGVGIICETEADMVSNAIASDHGHWSEVIRCSFDHDPLSYNRRMDREYRELMQSFLAVLISGTPGQVKPLIPSSENGLFSRQVFYYMPRVRKWVDQFKHQRTDASMEFKKLGKEWIGHLREIQRLGLISLRLTDTQIDAFNKAFGSLFDRSQKATDSEMNSSVVRMAINIGRILSIVALLRVTDECEETDDFAASLRKSPRLTPDEQTCADNMKDGIVSRWDLSIQDEDFEAVLSLAEPLYLHAVHILSFLPANEVKSRGMADQERLFSSMGTVFTSQSLLEQAEILKISKNTALSCLQRWQKRGTVRKGEQRGDYKKI